MIDNQYYKRQYVISGIAIGVVVVYLLLLFHLQLIDQTSKDKALSLSLSKQIVYPARGMIYDRNDSLLVYNLPIYEVAFIQREMNDDNKKLVFDTLGFCELLHIDRQAFDDRMAWLKNKKNNPGWSVFTPQVFCGQLKKEDISQLQEELYRFHGILIRSKTIRNYNCHEAAHILGNVGEVNWDDIKADDYYSLGDYSGRDGVERTYEHELRGQKGVIKYMRDSRGRIKGRYKNGEEDIEAISGSDLHLTIDIELQKTAEHLLNGKLGSAVAIEPETGEILAMASCPTWDPQLLVGKDRGKNYVNLLKDNTKPLLNRATQATYSPGSTFKTLQSLICLQDNIITPGKVYACNGRNSEPIKCTHSHGSPVNIISALEQSCNPYYWCAFRDFINKGNDGTKNSQGVHDRYNFWREQVLQFGFSQKFTDSDISPQSSGSIPTEDYFNRMYGEHGWKAATIRSLSIGQGEILVTPLQLANQAATIANEGYYITPHLNRSDSLMSHKHVVNIKPQHFRTVKEGMARVMTNGTGKAHRIPGIEVCGKTGTVQNGRGKDHAIFIGFAPKNHPKIAVAVVVENMGFGSTWAVPVATSLISKYLDSIHYTEDKSE